jgi:gamma-D-glutamyl-L-lysine dipeptidyl-peptidase
MLGFAAMLALAAAVPNGVVLQPVANMYSKPSPDADVVSQAIYGANVALLERQSGWMRVRTADDYTGWMAAASLREGSPYAAAGRVARVTSLFANIYREADVTKHAPLVTVPFETRFEVSAEPAKDARWAAVRLPNSEAGWVQAGDVAFEPKLLTVPEVLEFAKHFLGLPYTWGGTSTFGYDCSGFMQMVNRQRGLNLPRDAQPQADWSGLIAVERKDLQPGDLLYFGSSAKHITHTGMYLGGGKFISATTYLAPMVRIDDLSDPHFAGILVAMRRVK